MHVMRAEPESSATGRASKDDESRRSSRRPANRIDRRAWTRPARRPHPRIRTRPSGMTEFSHTHTLERRNRGRARPHRRSGGEAHREHPREAPARPLRERPPARPGRPRLPPGPRVVTAGGGGVSLPQASSRSTHLSIRLDVLVVQRRSRDHRRPVPVRLSRAPDQLTPGRGLCGRRTCAALGIG